MQGKSTLSGTVAFNPNFGTGNAARIILNEVTSNSTTALEGYTEIFGQRAALVIANPNGITAAGAGFINLSRLTMVTGKPNMVGGKLQDFTISQVGTISIKGKGEQAFGLHILESPAELVSNAVKIAGNIYVDNDQELNIKTGNHQYDYNTKQITSKNDIAAQSILALDSSALGGMYAGKIKIEATQSGMGVKIDGNLVSDMEHLEITADGDIAFKNVAAKNNIKVVSESGSVEHKKDGIVHTEQDLIIIASKDIALNGTSYASNDILTEANKNLNIQGIAFADNNINLTAPVRGFRNEGIQGDSGYLWRNDISFNAATLVKSDNKILKGIDFGPFIDYGYVRSNHKDINSEILSGAGGKISFKYRYFDSSISYANVLKNQSG